MSRRGVVTIRRGFSLIELVAVIAVLGAIGSVVTTLLLGTFDGYLSGSTRAQLQAEASVALDRLVREWRSMPRDEAAADIAPDITSFDEDSITWSDEMLSLVGGELLLSVDDGAQTALVRDVTSFTMAAFDEGGQALALPLDAAGSDAVRRISISLTLSRDGASISMRTAVFIRATMAGAATGGGA